MLALFKETGVYGTDFVLRVGTEDFIREQLSYENDWLNLVECGRSMGPKKDQKKLDELEAFLSCEQTRASFESFKIEISTGLLACIMVAENRTELEEMKQYLEANLMLNAGEMGKFRSFFDQVLGMFDNADLYEKMSNKIASRQYITSGISLDSF